MSLWRRWWYMKQRCENPNTSAWPRYGGRGIRICDEWQSFDAFRRDMEEGFLPHLTLDRIDVNGNYEPSNCRWLTRQEQANNRRTNRMVTWQNRTQTAAAWERELGMAKTVLANRLRQGWTVEAAMTTPASNSRCNRCHATPVRCECP